MHDPSCDELLRKLTSSLRRHEKAIKSGVSKLCLTGNSLVFLDKCFGQLINGKRKDVSSTFYSQSSQSCVKFLHQLSKEAVSLKVVPGPSPHLDILLNISGFRNLQYLEIKKIPLGYVLGIQSLRQQLKGITCFRSLFALSEVFICCGGDLSSTPFAWERLQEANLSHNSINRIDDSLKVLPALEVLNLSHNNIVSHDDDDNWQSLAELKYVNLGYNQLNKIPNVMSLKHSLRTLILRNNDIQNLRGVEQFKLLEVLDVSNNCIATFQELFPIAHLERLLSIQLSGNPVCYAQDYRVCAVSCMSPFPRKDDIYLDNVKLSSYEKTFVGLRVDPVSPLAYLSLNASEEDGPSSIQDDKDQSIAPATSKKKKPKKAKPRNVSIVSDVEDENISSSAVSSQGEVSLDHSQDIERLEKARDLGGEHWLPAVTNVLHGESKEQTSTTDEKIDSLLSTSPYFVHHEDVVVDVNPCTMEREPSIESFHSDDEQLDAGIIQPFIVTLKTDGSMDGSHDSDKEEHIDLLVTITDHFIRERDVKNGKVVCKLETDSLLSANIEESEDGDLLIHLKFDYLSNERKQRYYIMDGSENCEQFMELLSVPLSKSSKASKATIQMEHLQCLKCSAHFTEKANKTGSHICPDCGSTQIIEIHSPNDTETTRDVEGSSEPQTLPDLISSMSPKTTLEDQPDIYRSNQGHLQPEHELEFFREKPIHTLPCNSSRTDSESPLSNLETHKCFSLHPSQERKVNNDECKQLMEKFSSSTQGSPLSRSLKRDTSSRTFTPQKRVIDSPISLKTSTRKTSSDKPPEISKLSQQVDNDWDSSMSSYYVERTKKTSTVQSGPSLKPRVFRNLFNKFDSKMSGNDFDEQDSVDNKAPSIDYKLIEEISLDEFTEFDHRLKLYFEVSLFTQGQNESLQCLIKAPVIVYGDKKESLSLVVVSNTTIYVQKVEEGKLSKNECLSLHGSYSLKDVQFVDFSQSFQCVRIEINGPSSGSFTIIMRDSIRCKAFTDIFLGFANQCKDDNYLPPLTTTNMNLQTAHHISSLVLGNHQEDEKQMGKRYEQQITIFTDPPLIKDRKSLLRCHSKCFVGKDIVDWMVHNAEAHTRNEAVGIMQRLVNAGVVEHVSKECKFEDKEQFYRFTPNMGNEQNEDICQDEIQSTIMAFKVHDSHDTKIRTGNNLQPVTIIITKTYITLAVESPLWPLPRYLDVPTPKELHFTCIEKHKITDVTGLELFDDRPCSVGLLISEEDAPLESSEYSLLVMTATPSTTDTLVHAIKKLWEDQFGVELHITSQ